MEMILTEKEIAKLFRMSYATFHVKSARACFEKFRTKTKRLHGRKGKDGEKSIVVPKVMNAFIVNDEFRELMKGLQNEQINRYCRFYQRDCF